MLTAFEVEKLTEKFFEEKALHFEGSFPVKEGNETVMRIYVWGPQGRFEMKMTQNKNLFSRSKDGKRWIPIKKY
ncbi:hypothetical protein [Enterococcus wangshanyuanii]|uniref:Uncharacterized protein n=1 Tax=Enterococcus wangshanyuanii TaxID=2005703 RepID=A0ABQ1P0C1_9ENTE|nr:hypothetical protein [Enterococcus wangshanyuanii]GGC88222.1 hypothetical protein GCM10011573_17290 [Enterococcus wangshanyuanii]